MGKKKRLATIADDAMTARRHCPEGAPPLAYRVDVISYKMYASGSGGAG
jgi:hypothetical protein